MPGRGIAERHRLVEAVEGGLHGGSQIPSRLAFYRALAGQGQGGNAPCRRVIFRQIRRSCARSQLRRGEAAIFDERLPVAWEWAWAPLRRRILPVLMF
ncbi:MAG: hypothetical protein MZV64_62615 [Ignavibacteriales bacterium]|nr:hypothetical protein [Ignavibacteriales bacterium]